MALILVFLAGAVVVSYAIAGILYLFWQWVKPELPKIGIFIVWFIVLATTALLSGHP